MNNIKIITVGSLKEPYLRSAAAEYEKRLSAFCKLQTVELKEARVYDGESAAAARNALADEAIRINEAIPPKLFTVAMCVEGRETDSRGLAELVRRACDGQGGVCFIIGSSHGLDESIKQRADARISLSQLTFPHQLFRVMLLEAIYRSFNIIKGTKYHK